jgi:hypothetical protein
MFEKLLSCFHSMKLSLGKDLFAKKESVTLVKGHIEIRFPDLQLSSGRINVFANAVVDETGYKKIITRLRAPLEDRCSNVITYVEIDISLPVSEVEKLDSLRYR